ncbi:acyltransferase [Crateriforma conspicua]|uniref:acyltransferase n=1 Tax=Crateriforma conspicua TaxID=2527996 RepID=UPI001188CD27|nr:acyltransferase [Crateriforma conspicua]QDV65940.1 Maltose O-acetyltransferase [Crateriforma conspicua]
MSGKLLRRIASRGSLWTLPLDLGAAAGRFVRRKTSVVLWGLRGLRTGDRCHLGPGVRCADPKSVSLGDRVTLGAGVRLATETYRGRLSVGDRVEIGRYTILDFSGDLTIEDDALVSEGAIVYTHDHGYDPRSQPAASSLVLKRNCWIGSRAIILPSVNSIGENAIVGSGAVVTKDVPDGHVYVAGPGRLLKRKDLE